MKVTVDGYKDWEPEKVLDNGWYEARCVAADPTTTRNGDPAVNIRYEIVSGPEQSHGQDPEGRVVFDMLMLQYSGQKAKGEQFVKDKIMRTILSMNIADENGEFDTDDMVGTEVEIALNTDEYQGKKKNSVNDIRPVGGFPEE